LNYLPINSGQEELHEYVEILLGDKVIRKVTQRFKSSVLNIQMHCGLNPKSIFVSGENIAREEACIGFSWPPLKSEHSEECPDSCHFSTKRLRVRRTFRTPITR
jgi:hypothetical protein